MATKRSLRLMIVRAAEDAGALDMLHRHTAIYQRKDLLSLVDLPLLLANQSDISTLLPHLAASADGALFILSEYYLTSVQCLDIQEVLLATPSFLGIPLLYQSCDWEELSGLRERMPLPRNRQFISASSAPAAAWTDVARDLGAMAKQLQPTLGPLHELPLATKTPASSTNLHAQAREWLATNQLPALLDQLMVDSASKRDLQNELILLKGNYQQLAFQQTNGLVSAGEVQVGMAGIRFALLQLIEKVYK